MSDRPVALAQEISELAPHEIKKWNWGAFFWNWIWGLSNRTYIALICLIPIPLVPIVMMIILGAKGSEWAYRNKRWDSIDHFKHVQKKWAWWGFGVFIIFPLISIVITTGIIYSNRGTLLEMAMDKMVEGVMTNLPEGYDQAMARQTFDEFIVAVKENRVDKEELQELGEIMQAIMADKKLETQEVDQLMEVLQKSSQ